MFYKAIQYVPTLNIYSMLELGLLKKAGYFKTRLRPYSYWVALTLLDKDVE